MGLEHKRDDSPRNRGQVGQCYMKVEPPGIGPGGKAFT